MTLHCSVLPPDVEVLLRAHLALAYAFGRLTPAEKRFTRGVMRSAPCR